MEGRRDPDAASSACCRPARAASRCCGADMAGPGVAGGWLCLPDAAHRPARWDAADRHPGTILRWHRDIVRRRWARRSRRGRSGRPAVRRDVRSVVLRLARENESWDTGGSMANSPGSASPWRRQRSGRSSRTLASARRRAGTARAGPNSCGPRPRRCWRWFFTADLLNGTKVYVLAAIEHGTRRIRILGATGHPVQSWVVQQARNLLMDLEDAGMSVKFVLHDRDASFTAAFDAVSRPLAPGSSAPLFRRPE